MEQHMDVTGDESEYDMLSLYCRHHELIYGHVPERIGLILKETERKMKVLETRIS